jgi:predicted metal-binding protein
MPERRAISIQTLMTLHDAVPIIVEAWARWIMTALRFMVWSEESLARSGFMFAIIPSRQPYSQRSSRPRERELK